MCARKTRRQRRAAWTACCTAARRIVGRPARIWGTRHCAQRALDVRARMHSCPTAAQSDNAVDSGAVVVGGGAKEGFGRMVKADRWVAGSGSEPPPIASSDGPRGCVREFIFPCRNTFKLAPSFGWAKKCSRMNSYLQSIMVLRKDPLFPALKSCNRCVASPTIIT